MTSWRTALVLSFILSNSSMQQIPLSLKTSAPLLGKKKNILKPGKDVWKFFKVWTTVILQAANGRIRDLPTHQGISLKKCRKKFTSQRQWETHFAEKLHKNAFETSNMIKFSKIHNFLATTFVTSMIEWVQFKGVWKQRTHVCNTSCLVSGSLVT